MSSVNSSCCFEFQNNIGFHLVNLRTVHLRLLHKSCCCNLHLHLHVKLLRLCLELLHFHLDVRRRRNSMRPFRVREEHINVRHIHCFKECSFSQILVIAGNLKGTLSKGSSLLLTLHTANHFRISSRTDIRGIATIVFHQNFSTFALCKVLVVCILHEEQLIEAIEFLELILEGTVGALIDARENLHTLLN